MSRKRPTDKQIRYLQDVLGAKSPREAYAYIDRVTPTHGGRRVTIGHAGRAIDKAKRERS